MQTPKHLRSTIGFTLVELLTVIAIIAVLMGILFPTIGSAIESAKKTQAKNDALQIVNAVKAYYTEYGKYPVKQGATGDSEYITDNDRLLNILRATGASGYDLEMNPRKIVFLEVPASKKPDHAKAKSGLCSNGHFHDPWGGMYQVRMDGDYNNELANPYSNAGFSTINTGVISWTTGRDGAGGSGNKLLDPAKDDVISWQ